MLRVAIDIGGTFTDVVAQTPNELTSVKVLTTPSQPEIAALEGVQRLLSKLSKNHTDITSIVHGTTLATNALIERKGAKTAFITTAGFRDVLEMRYEKRFDQYALGIEFPDPLIPRPLRIGIPERMLADGSVYQAPDPKDIDAIVSTLKAQEIEAVAIGFLHAYKNPEHENFVANYLAGQLDNQITVCQSAQVASEIREYERFSTVCANAYVRPLMGRYLDKLLMQLNSNGFCGSFLMMLSDGALTTIDKAMRFPIRLVEGGPAGGVALAAHVAVETGSTKTLALDIGGTTAKICFIENGKPKTSRRFEIARSWKGIKGSGLPVRVPTVELVEIGAGGGSIANIDALQRLQVGPRSASSFPGPAAYDQGGEQATLTDAHITLGNLEPDGFADGMIDLAPELANEAIAKHIQVQLGMDRVESAAAGIVEMANETLANAARVHGIEQGLDIASFDLLVSGGGGGLHGARVAEKLGIQRVLVPDNAGVGSAVGFLHSPVAFESAVSVLEKLSEIDSAVLSTRLAKTREQVFAIVAEAVPEDNIRVAVTAELRYVGQGLEFLIDVLERDPDRYGLATTLDNLAKEFRARYRAKYGFVLDDIPIELVTLSVCASELRSPLTSSLPIKNTNHQTSPTTRTVFTVQNDQAVQYQVFDREAIGDDTLQGPIVVPESQTTTLVPTGWTIDRSSQGHLIMHRCNE